MTALRSPRNPGLLLLGPLSLLALLPLGCGDDSGTKAGGTPAPAAPAKTDLPPVAAAASTSGGSGTGGGTIADPFETDGWAQDDTDSDGVATVGIEVGGTGSDTDGEAVAQTPVFDGPCYVRWSKGPVLRFRYDADGGGGRLTIDGDNDGSNDVCARFWTKDDRTNKVTVDAGCDKSTDAIISPSYDEGTNLATASYTDKSGETDAKHEITLITLPAFTGIAPGYPLYAARDDIQLKVTDGLVVQATVKDPIEGPKVRVKLSYDDDGRVTRINEDHGADGTIDRRFDYRYDEVGNVTGITLQETDDSSGKASKTKKTAKLGYSCWAPKP